MSNYLLRKQEAGCNSLIVQSFIKCGCLLLQSPEEVFMEIRRPLEWHCTQMDHFVGLNFSANFNFALVGHLLKGNLVWRECGPAPGRTHTVFLTAFCVCRLQTPIGHHGGEDGEDPAHAVGSHQQASEM